MNGKWVAAAILGPALLAGAAVWWLQVYAYYERVEPVGPHEMTLVTTEGAPVPLRVEDWEGIDASSSPQRFRACFRTHLPQDQGFQPYPGAEPLNAPGWFDCFDARQIGEALERGEARAYLSARNVHVDVDRVIAIFPDGRAYAWQQFNPAAKE